MSGFAGFGGFDGSLWEERFLWSNLCRRMCARLSHRGGGTREQHVSPSCVMSCTLSQAAHGRQPFSAVAGGRELTIVFDGMISNGDSLRYELTAKGYSFETETDAETALKAYIEYGLECPEKFSGSYAFTIDDTYHNRIFLCRDRFGAKPLFYTCAGDRIIFASEIKALFEYPGIRPVVGRGGLCELFSFGPVRTPGKCIFENIFEIEPGSYAVFSSEGLQSAKYYELKAVPNNDTPDELAAGLQNLMGELLSASKDSPSYVFLTGDFEFCDSQTELCSKSVFDAVIARDMPGVPCFDSYLINLCRQIRENNAIAICDFSSDIIFGQSCLDGIGIPWPGYAGSIIKPEILESIDMYSYTANICASRKIPLLGSESPEEAAHRKEYYMRIFRYLPAMLETADRCAMYSGLELITPWADHRLIESIYSLPPAFSREIMVKAGLTHSPAPLLDAPLCGELNAEKFRYILCDSLQPIHKIISAGKLCRENQPKLNPRLAQYLMQINYWMIRYNIYIDI